MPTENFIKRPNYQNIPRPAHHFAFDGYDVSQDKLCDSERLRKFLFRVNQDYFDQKAVVLISNIDPTVSYNPLDYGMLGYVVDSSGYFVCRTSEYYRAMFVDFYMTPEREYGGLVARLTKVFAPRHSSQCRDQISTGHYGSHFVCLRDNPITHREAEELFDQIAAALKLQPIEMPFCSVGNDYHYTFIYPTLEGYLTAFSNEDSTVVSVFSRKRFDPAIVRRAVEADACYSVQRGSRIELDAMTHCSFDRTYEVPPEVLNRRLRPATSEPPTRA